jgi:hypothetical protein
MTLSEQRSEGTSTVMDLLTVLTLVPGIGFVGVGSYIHLTVTAQARTGQCDGCEPWHPLFVLAPLVVGSLLVLVGGYLRYHR